MTTDATVPPVFAVCRVCHMAHHPRSPHIFTGIAAGAAGGKVACVGCRDRDAIIEQMGEERAPLVAQIDQLKQERAIDRDVMDALRARISVLVGQSSAPKTIKAPQRAAAKGSKRPKRRKRAASIKAKAPGAQSPPTTEPATRLSNPTDPPA